MANTIDSFLNSYSSIVETHNRIDPELFKKYNVKRGLRNEDGTGVLVGLTEIGNVHGYILDEGEKVPVPGKLYYRGYDVEELVKGCNQEKRFGFEEISFLLLFGKLPNAKELKEFQEVLGEFRTLPNGFFEDMILKAPSPDIMNKLARSVLASYSYDSNPEDSSLRNILRQSIELIARFPTMVAYAYQVRQHYYYGKSLYLHSPNKDLSTAENLLLLIRPNSTYKPLEAELLDLALILHAEHGGGNNSTFTIRVVSSAATDTYSAVAAALGSLKGAKHGGANNRVMEMMEDIEKNVKDWKDEEELAAYLKKILRKEAGDRSGLIYGIGHAVYTLSDPRAVLLKEKAKILAEEKGFSEEFNLYDRIERIAPRVFKEERNWDKPLAPNVDFFSGFVYKMLNIPDALYTPIFAIARISGWAAHRIEEVVSGGKIIRPAYKNVYTTKEEYIPLAQRS
ncbi:MAG TPA: citrate/2-methylcitrate synthase [Spirochaetales bacterium]|nr:citrate/2-methylcitrate synthase [Spirochaetales bacterium]